ncbi:MAG: nucleotidyl transferase AbiEii/AbiGii toxin family protein [Myxococcales bacterium]|nr:nucleotidyl transferase AbiEii/AbiGii toxin family protein [Myxococcales bacterium]
MERLRQFIVDRFVARLHAVFGDGFILKGGFVLELRLASARTTRDVDLTLFGDPRALLSRLQAAGRLDLDDFFTF